MPPQPTPDHPTPQPQMPEPSASPYEADTPALSPEAPIPQTPIPTVPAPEQGQDPTTFTPTVIGPTMGGVQLSPNTPAPQAAPSALPPTSPSIGTPNTQQPGQAMQTPGQPSPAPKKGKKKLLAVIIPLVVIVVGGAAAAYYGYYKPNQPGSMLRRAITTTLQEKQVSFNGTINVDSTDTAATSYKIAIKGAGNLPNKQLDAQLTVTTGGTSFPIEARMVNDNLYIKLGDLESLMGFIDSMGGESDSDLTTEAALSNLITAVAGPISNQWIEFDSTALKQVGASCALDTNWSLSSADIDMLTQAYQKNSFVTIKGTANGTVDGQAAEKFDLSINDNKAATFVKNFNRLSIIKSYDNCENGKSGPTSGKSLADGDATPLSIWVNKKTYQIVRISSESTAQDLKEDHLKASGIVNLSYKPTTIAAPSNAKPYPQVFNEVEQSLAANPGTAEFLDLLLGGLGSTDSSAGLFTQSL